MACLPTSVRRLSSALCLCLCLCPLTSDLCPLIFARRHGFAPSRLVDVPRAKAGVRSPRGYPRVGPRIVFKIGSSSPIWRRQFSSFFNRS